MMSLPRDEPAKLARLHYDDGRLACRLYSCTDGRGVMKARQLNIKLDDQTIARLDHLARVTGRSKSFYAREFIRSGLDEMEDWYLAQYRLEEFRQSDDSTIPLEKMDWS